MIGALILGPVADRVGRKKIIVFSSIAFSIGTLCLSKAPAKEMRLSRLSMRNIRNSKAIDIERRTLSASPRGYSDASAMPA
ncbi:MFS transporter [Tardiphaga sp. 42S5]|uniref:MFS transporter n=1 Tax=Tardiphaga sp. 42S5 TaxID=1404799 RepID=UPI002A5AAC0A|nr:MFS transporter [Tardiphaga sp. 42S5]WPO43245.1 MFS transporter [Tardiphaga sp. 42S5]